MHIVQCQYPVEYIFPSVGPTPNRHVKFHHKVQEGNPKGGLLCHICGGDAKYKEGYKGMGGYVKEG